MAVTEPDFQGLRDALDGNAVVSTPGDAGYDDAVRIWNAAITRRPSVVVGCTSDIDVSAALRFAQQEGLEVSVRGGGHNYAGLALTDGGLMIDLTPLKTVTVDPAARRATCGGGATWGELDAELGLYVDGFEQEGFQASVSGNRLRRNGAGIRVSGVGQGVPGDLPTRVRVDRNRVLDSGSDGIVMDGSPAFVYRNRSLGSGGRDDCLKLECLFRPSHLEGEHRRDGQPVQPLPGPVAPARCA